MTDNIAHLPVPPQSPPQVPPQPVPQMTEEQQIESIKGFLFQGSLKHYQDFSAGINRLPMDGNLKRIIIEKLDDAWLWVKEGFQVLQIQLPKPPEAPKAMKKAIKKKKRK